MDQELEVIMTPAYLIRGIYYIFRNDGQEVEINNKNQTSTHQLNLLEVIFINNYYPQIQTENLKTTIKIYF